VSARQGLLAVITGIQACKGITNRLLWERETCFGMQTVAESGENPYSDPRGQYSLSTGPGEVPDYRPKLFPAHGKEDHAMLRPPPVFPARVTSSVPSQAPLEWPSCGEGRASSCPRAQGRSTSTAFEEALACSPGSTSQIYRSEACSG
jgi:hypothetical protein